MRLSSLARLRLYNQTSAELTNLFTVLNAVDPPSAREWLFDHILPFELEVMYARIKYWAGDHMGHLDALNGLLRKCRTKARAAKGDDAVRAMWQERGARVCLITASQLMEMKVSLLLIRFCIRAIDELWAGLRSSRPSPGTIGQPRSFNINISSQVVNSSHLPPKWISCQSLTAFCGSRNRSRGEPSRERHECCTSRKRKGGLAAGKREAQKFVS